VVHHHDRGHLLLAHQGRGALDAIEADAGVRGASGPAPVTTRAPASCQGYPGG
jgi:hypothetical protein